MGGQSCRESGERTAGVVELVLVLVGRRALWPFTRKHPGAVLDPTR